LSKIIRPYQQKAIDNTCSELIKGTKTQLWNMSMGTGKTFTAVKCEEQLKSKKTIWLTEDERLLEQSALAFIADKFDDKFTKQVEKEGFINFCRQGGQFGHTGFKASIVKADLFDTSGNVVFVSAQTLWRRLDLLDPELFDIMIVDECHLAGSKKFYEGMSHFDTRLRLGLSGTPFRKDGMMMGDMFEKISFDYPMRDAIRDGYLCELNAIRIKTNTNLDTVHTLMGDFNDKELSQTVNNPARNFLIADSYLKYCKGRRMIGFGVDIQHCMDLAEAFQIKGINATAVSSDEERTGNKNKKIRAYKNGDHDVLFNVNLLSKGFDDPDTGGAISAAPTKSIVRYLQGPAGRPSRLKSPEFVAKFGQNAIILDVVDNTNSHNLINAWELDKMLPPEERCFITNETRDKLLAERLKKNTKLEFNRGTDEFVKLLSIPRIKVNFKSEGMDKIASEKQLSWVRSLGYDVDNDVYTIGMCSEIINQQPLSRARIEELNALGYDTQSRVLTNADYNAVQRELWIKQQQKKKK